MLDRNLQQSIILNNREFIKGVRESDPYMADFESDQQRKLPQPPLVKEPMAPPQNRYVLPRDFSPLAADLSLEQLLLKRHSSRAYAKDASLSLLQLSYLLWATQGVKSLRGKGYATLRTVPSGGARHPFESYLLIRHTEGLQPGAYHYLPMEHALEYLHPVDEMSAAITSSLYGQSWGSRAAVVFYWSMVAYRAEWRYGIYAHRTAMIDVGHVGQNLYLAAAALGLGVCGIAAFDDSVCSRLFGLDGREEFVVYTATVGVI